MAQNLQLHFDPRHSLYGNDAAPINFMTATFEMYKPDKWGSTFMFADFDFSYNDRNLGLVYTEIARDFKIKGFPLMPHFEYNGGFFFNFEIPEDNLGLQNSPTYFEVIIVESEKICSEIYDIKSTDYFTENKIIHISAYNNDARRGIITELYPALGFFQTTGFNEDVFVNTKTEYEYSYNRKKILSSENNIAKRLTFVNLSMYQQNLLKWLCNCENFLIDGVQYELISDFTELLSDENSEVKDLRADFIPTNQSFFGNGSGIAPNNVFPTDFFMK